MYATSTGSFQPTTKLLINKQSNFEVSLLSEQYFLKIFLVIVLSDNAYSMPVQLTIHH